MSAAAIKHYFTKEARDIYKCICDGKPRKQSQGSGNSNLYSHINAKHPNCKNEILTDQSTLTGVSRGGKNMFPWIKWIIECNLPVHVC